MVKFPSFGSNGIFLGLFVLILGGLTASAQSTIFNTPSTDTVQKKDLYIEADFGSHFDSYKNGGYQFYGYRNVYGLRKNFEVGFNLYYTRLGGASPAEFQPNFKFKVFESEKYGVAASTGLIVSTPLNKAAGNRTTGFVYSNVSKVVKQTGGLRLTGGIYTVVGADSSFGTKSGVTIGVEQPIRGRFSFLGDWSSGKNRYGYAAAALNYSITNRSFVAVGYNFGNYGRGNNGLAAFYGLTF